MAEDEEAEGPNNVRLFRIAISNSLKNIAESVSESDFLEIFTVLKSKPSSVRKLHKTMTQELYSSMSRGLEDLLEEGSLRDAMTKIAKLSEEATVPDTEEAWRPPGDVTLHLRSLDAHKIKEASEQLEKQVIEMEGANEALMETIAESRSRICAINDNLTRVLDCAPTMLQRLQNTYEQLATCLKSIE
ncbi:hypothetical protein DMN91_005540 [Ooceraea biroi]|uniref:Polyamine-modulated factor n=1 Tax=Ooceraea biroi TaxID=2015173 RepID=A0A026X0Q4_OOCBI|nr:uncharacterized protein LOC105281505 [Ooceraea biroi]EZA61867.1 hypothetical protein X777_04678 [Ooceraea biroi]RLU21167.1 hypothetical protein DMN91_005540 [Ooceraea biroi]